MPSSNHSLTTTWQPILNLSGFPILYFNIEIINYDGTDADFAFGDPNLGAQVEIQVSGNSASTKDNRPLRGFLYGRCASGISPIKINVW